MAVCVISAVMDTDSDIPGVQPACVVHASWAPCQLNGEPASPLALEGIDGDPGGRDAALASWALKTKQQRPFLLHHGTWGDDRMHAGSAGCWCRPERFEANG